MKSIVIALGGSVVLSEDLPSTFFKDLKNLIEKSSEKHQIYIVVGGGKTARKYIKIGRKLNFDEAKLDEIGIEATRLNAKFLSRILVFSNQHIPKSVDEALNLQDKVVVMGGTQPGHSTDLVAAEIAEKTDASKLVIATNVDGIYDRDPAQFADAKLHREISIDKLIETYGTKWEAAGKNTVIDGPALAVIKKSKIPTAVLNGKNLEELRKAISNNTFYGTKIEI
ncbi:MAG: UMP kinase [Candidatus Thermoplasmatota archaeon]